MTIHEFGDKNNPVIMLFPGTMCYWRGNFGGVIDTLAEKFLVAAVAYTGFDEGDAENYTCMEAELEKIEAYIDDHYDGRIRAAAQLGAGPGSGAAAAATGSPGADASAREKQWIGPEAAPRGRRPVEDGGRRGVAAGDGGGTTGRCRHDPFRTAQARPAGTARAGRGAERAAQSKPSEPRRGPWTPVRVPPRCATRADGRHGRERPPG